MENYRSYFDEPVMVVSAENFKKMEKSAKLNDQQIKEEAERLYKKYLKETGIDMNIQVSDGRNLLHSHVTYDEKHSCYTYGWDVVSDTDYNIANQLIDEINKVFEPKRQELIKKIKDDYRENKYGFQRSLTIWQMLAYTATIGWIGTIIGCIVFKYM